MYSSSMVYLADLVRCMAVAKSDEQLNGMAQACGFERKPAENKEETVNSQPTRQRDEMPHLTSGEGEQVIMQNHLFSSPMIVVRHFTQFAER